MKTLPKQMLNNSCILTSQQNSDGEYDDSLREAAYHIAAFDDSCESSALEEETGRGEPCLANACVSPIYFLNEDISEYRHYIAAGLPIHMYLSLDKLDACGNSGVELYLSTELSKLSMKYDFCQHQHVTLMIYAAGPTSKVVQTDQDLLTKEEVKIHAK